MVKVECPHCGEIFECAKDDCAFGGWHREDKHEIILGYFSALCCKCGKDVFATIQWQGTENPIPEIITKSNAIFE